MNKNKALKDQSNMGIGLGVSGLTYSEHESSKVYDGLY